MRLIAIIILAAGGLAAWPCAGQEAATPSGCEASDTTLPAELQPWTAGGPAPSAAAEGQLAEARLTVGATAIAILHPQDQVAYPAAPEKPVGPEGHGGLFALNIEAAGRYGVGLDSGAWIDVLFEGRPVASTGHSHGPSCSGMQKIVDFSLLPGRYIVQLSSSPTPNTRILVFRRPSAD